MIELKIDGDLAQYVDTYALQERAESEVKYAVKDWVNKALQDHDTVKKDISKYILEKASNIPFDLSDELKDKLYDKMIVAVNGYSDWDIKYNLKLDDKVKDEYFANECDFQRILSQSVADTINNYVVPNYMMDDTIRSILKEKILARQDELKLDEIVDGFITSGLERLMY